MSLTKASYSLINGAPLNVLDYGATGNGTTNDTAAIQLAVTAAYAQERALYFPTGTYLMASTITMGNNTADAAKFCYFFGDGKDSVIKVTAANVNPFLWQGPNPEVDGAGNRIDGRILIEKLRFLGPSSASTNTNSIGIKFYGVQGITLRDCTFNGWRDGEFYHNCDIVSRYNIYSQSNYNGVNSLATGYAINSSLNSFNSYGGLVANNSNYGIYFLGGLNPCWFGVNFVANGTSIICSPNYALAGMVTASPNIIGCYFENDTATSIQFGGGSGIVRGGVIQGCNLIAQSANPLITIANYSNGFGRGTISNNTIDVAFSGSSFITQATSAEFIDVNNLNGTPIGNVTPSTGVFTTVNSGTFTKGPIAASGTSNIFSIGGAGVVASISITIYSVSTGKATLRKYQVAFMGGGTVTGSDISSVTEVYSGGGSPFTLSETQDSPTVGTNKLTITNNDSVASTYYITYTIEYASGTLTVL